MTNRQDGPRRESTFYVPEFSVLVTTNVSGFDHKRPSACQGDASVARVDGERLAEVDFVWSRSDEPDPWEVRADVGQDASGVDWLLEIGIPRVRRESKDRGVDLYLVGSLVAHMSAGRGVFVTMIAEPKEWQSLRISRRAAARPLLAAYWGPLGFRVSNDWSLPAPQVVDLSTRDYMLPDELQVGDRRRIEV